MTRFSSEDLALAVLPASMAAKKKPKKRRRTTTTCTNCTNTTNKPRRKKKKKAAYADAIEMLLEQLREIPVEV